LRRLLIDGRGQIFIAPEWILVRRRSRCSRAWAKCGTAVSSRATKTLYTPRPIRISSLRGHARFKALITRLGAK
jgi:hypothetical protein